MIDKKEGGRVYLFLSSGSHERYRQDVLRAIAMPPGMDLQFRYTRGLLSNQVQQQLRERRDVIGKRGLIAFLDRKDSTPAENPDLVPCRYVTVRDFVPHGDAITLQLRLGDFPRRMESDSAVFIQRFNAEAHQKLGDGYPRFERDENGNRSEPNPRGHFWSLTEDNWESLAPLVTTDWNELCGEWERIVRILQGRENFTGEPYFFLFRGFWSLDEQRAETPDKNKLSPHATGVYPLVAGRAYELSLFHYMPGRAPTDPRTRLIISASNPIITFTSSTQFPVDSGYDEKKARFVVDASTGGGSGIFSISGSHWKMIGDKEQEVTVSWFDLPFEVPSNYLWNGFKGAVVATPLAIGTTIAIATNDKITRQTQMWLVPLAFLGTWLSGIAGAIWVKK